MMWGCLRGRRGKFKLEHEQASNLSQMALLPRLLEVKGSDVLAIRAFFIEVLCLCNVIQVGPCGSTWDQLLVLHSRYNENN